MRNFLFLNTEDDRQDELALDVMILREDMYSKWASAIWCMWMRKLHKRQFHFIYHFSNWCIIHILCAQCTKAHSNISNRPNLAEPCSPLFTSSPTFDPFLSYESSRLLARGNEPLNSHERLNRALVARSQHRSPFSPQKVRAQNIFISHS
jgi:hypothetical protein